MTTPKRLEYSVSERSGTPAHAEPDWDAEHLLLSALARCTLASLEYYAKRANVAVSGSAVADGVVTRRDSDGRFAFVEARLALDIEVEPALPDEALWKEAVRRASDIFGEVGTGAGRNPGNVASMVQALRRHASDKMGVVRDYRAALETRIGHWGVQDDCARMRTAHASLDLLIALADTSADTVSVLAQARVETSSAAMGAVMASAPALATTLRSSQWQVLETFRGLGRSDAPAAAVIDATKAALAADEHVTRLDAELSRQHGAALKLMVAPPPLPPPPPPRPSGPVRTIERRSADAAAVTSVMQELQQAMQEDASLRVDIECRVYREGGGEA